MKNTMQTVMLLGVVGLWACGGGGGGTYTLAGVAQKGPFALGTTVHIAELDDALTPTGRAFDTTITDDTGAFALPNVALASPYVALTADGFYFDEVGGALSASRIQLGALADMRTATSVNANLMSHLTQARTRKLIADGKDFSDAKAQAQAELLTVFGVTKMVAAAESLNIANGSADDAVLLAISAIVQGRRTPAQLTELCAQISADLMPDGVLTDALGLKLANSAAILDLAAVRANLAGRYEGLGVAATIGDFESIVTTFRTTTSFIPPGDITYPETGESINLLAAGVTAVPFVGNVIPKVSLTANVPPGKWLRVHITLTGNLFFSLVGNDAWTAEMVALSEKEYVATAEPKESATSRSLEISAAFQSGGAAKSIQIDVYENGADTPTFAKTIAAE